MKIEKQRRKTGWSYRARFMLAYTRFRSPWFTSQKEAKDWATERQAACLAGQVNTGAPITLEEFAQLWFEKHVEANKVFAQYVDKIVTMKRR